MTKKSSQIIMFSAGESSGDQHAANMFKELKKQLPDIKGVGMGSNKMQQAGIELQFDSSGIGVIGIFEVLKHYAEIRKALKLMKALLKAISTPWEQEKHYTVFPVSIKFRYRH